MSQHESLDEPRLQPVPLGPEKRFNDGIARTASILTSAVAALLTVLVVVALAGVVIDGYSLLVHDHAPMKAAVKGLDGAFIVVILLELVQTTLSRDSLSTKVQEFLVIGITSAVRDGLETAAGHAGEGRATAIDIAITALAALLLVFALWLVRQRLFVENGVRRDRDRRSGGDEAIRPSGSHLTQRAHAKPTGMEILRES